MTSNVSTFLLQFVPRPNYVRYNTRSIGTATHTLLRHDLSDSPPKRQQVPSGSLETPVDVLHTRSVSLSATFPGPDNLVVTPQVTPTSSYSVPLTSSSTPVSQSSRLVNLGTSDTFLRPKTRRTLSPGTVPKLVSSLYLTVEKLSWRDRQYISYLPSPNSHLLPLVNLRQRFPFCVLTW